VVSPDVAARLDPHNESRPLLASLEQRMAEAVSFFPAPLKKGEP
jgi:hypothetical protein